MIGFVTSQPSFEQPNIVFREIGNVPMPVDIHRRIQGG
jgi:hypothetical protein